MIGFTHGSRIAMLGVGGGLTTMRFLSFIERQYLFMCFQTLIIIYLFLLFFNTKVL